MLKIRSLPGADPPRHGDPHLGADAKFPGRRSRRAARTTFTAGKKSIIDTKSVFNHARSAKQIVQGHTYANGAKSDNSGAEVRRTRSDFLPKCCVDLAIEWASRGRLVHLIPSIWI